VLDAGHGHLQPVADPLQGFLGQPVILGLDVEEDLDEGALLAAVLVDDLVDSR